jgi:hypothetical protein
MVEGPGHHRRRRLGPGEGASAGAPGIKTLRPLARGDRQSCDEVPQAVANGNDRFMKLTLAEAVGNGQAWFEVTSGWAPPDDDTLAEWRADGVCRCRDDCLVTPEDPASMDWPRGG